MTNLEKAGAIIGVCAPAVAFVWYGAILVSEIDGHHERIEKLEARMDAYDEAQIVDGTVNRQVEALAKDMAWLTFHHHDGRAIGHDHEHELILGRGHVDGN